MKDCIDQRAFSYRSDPAVPEFDDSTPIAFMDGECVLCCFGARAISKLDRSGDIRICPVQSSLGQAVLCHFEMAPDDPESWLYLEQGKAYTGFDAMIRIALYADCARFLALAVARLPQSSRAWLYRRIARNRFWFGRTDICKRPSPDLLARLIR
ncbi:MAG: DUF393 domain-containing protein [Pseudomonadota bacterium]